MSWLQLASRTAIVTGAGSGIGSSVAIALANEGCNVILADHDESSLQKIQKDIIIQNNNNNNTTSKSTTQFSCDVTNPNQVNQLIQYADEFASSSNTGNNNNNNKFATLLVNCAGITRDGWISKLSIDDWDSVVDTNLKGTFLTCKEFVNKERIHQIIIDNNNNNNGIIDKNTTTSTTNNNDTNETQQEYCSIVNIGSIVSELGNLGQVNYAASKGGVLGLTRALAKEVAPWNVRVNAVVPGFIDTPMAQAVPAPIKQQIIEQKIPLGRFGQPQEVANLVTFLLSPRSSYITGESIRVSGMISL